MYKVWRILKNIVHWMFIFLVITISVLTVIFVHDFYNMRSSRINYNISSDDARLIENEFLLKLNNNEKILSTETYFGGRYMIHISGIDTIDTFIERSLELDSNDYIESIYRLNSRYKDMKTIQKKNVNNCKSIGIKLRKEAANSLYSVDTLIYIHNDVIYAIMQKDRIQDDLVKKIFNDGKKTL